MEKKPAAVIKPGDRFGHLTVTADSGERKNRYIVWECRCDCGRLIKIDKRTLIRGKVHDCGCITKVNTRQKNITGKRFGMLTAVRCTDQKTNDGDYIWHCVCDCGGEVDAPLHQLTVGYRKSCGCLSHPPLKDFIGKKFGRLTVTGYAGKKQGMHRWKCRCDCGREVIVGQSRLQSGTTKSCGCLRPEILREKLGMIEGTSVTFLESNLSRLRVNNTSGHTGVYLQKTTGHWVARISFRGKSYFLGSYERIEDAIKARKRGEEMHTDFLDWYYNEYLSEKEAEKDSDDRQGTEENEPHGADRDYLCTLAE